MEVRGTGLALEELRLAEKLRESPQRSGVKMPLKRRLARRKRPCARGDVRRTDVDYDFAIGSRRTRLFRTTR